MKLGAVELFGHTGLDEKKIRDAIPVREGDDLNPETWPAIKKRLAVAVASACGKPVVDTAIVGFDDKGRLMVFVGVAGPTVKLAAYRKLKGTKTQLHPYATKLDKDYADRLIPALQAGGGAEDDSNGYALFSDPQLRAIQLEMRRYALANEPLLHEVLGASKDVEQRKAAAQILGYAKHSEAQAASLLRATQDPDDTVRNNAVRALGVIIKSDAAMRKVIPASAFVNMVRSGVWTDRNKGAMVLDEFSRARDPKLLGQLKREAVPSLVEMARWRSPGHNSTARKILARIAGFPEEQVDGLAGGDMTPVYRALGIQ